MPKHAGRVCVDISVWRDEKDMTSCDVERKQSAGDWETVESVGEHCNKQTSSVIVTSQLSCHVRCCSLYGEEMNSTWIEVQLRLMVNQRPDVRHKELLRSFLFHVAELELREFLSRHKTQRRADNKLASCHDSQVNCCALIINWQQKDDWSVTNLFHKSRRLIYVDPA